MTTYPSAIGCIVVGLSPITSGGPCTAGAATCKVIPSYLYWQYRDDDNLQAFVDSYNTLAQEFMGWFCQLPLPIYTGDPITGALLNWVAQGLYGYTRPQLGAVAQRFYGQFNTRQLNTTQFSGRPYTATYRSGKINDDFYRRALTWHFYKGDGKSFVIRWLKRRVQRFLTKPDGTGLGINETYHVSVSFGSCCQVNITLKRLFARVTSSFRFNTSQFDVMKFAHLEIAVDVRGAAYADGPEFKDAVEQALLELPFQFTFKVAVQ